MGICTYCGDEAGWFKKAHQSCIEIAEQTRATQLAAREAWQIKLCDAAVNPSVDQRKLAAETMKVYMRGEAQELATAAFSAAVTNIIETTRHTTENILGAMADFVVAFDIKGRTIPERDWDRFVMMLTMLDLERGTLPTRFKDPGLGFSYDADEQAVWGWAGATYLEDQKQRVGGNVYGGVSMRVMEGLYVRTSAPIAQATYVEGLVPVATGNLIVTNRALWFQGPHSTVKVNLKDIATLMSFMDGFGFCCSRSGSRNRAFKIGQDDGWFAHDLVYRLNDRLKK